MSVIRDIIGSVAKWEERMEYNDINNVKQDIPNSVNKYINDKDIRLDIKKKRIFIYKIWINEGEKIFGTSSTNTSHKIQFNHIEFSISQ